MEGFKLDNLINNKYEKVLDIIGVVFKKDSEVLENRDKVFRLVFGNNENADRILDMFTIYWTQLPEELFNITSLNSLNKSIDIFTLYVSELEGEFKDHGYSVLIMFYLKACTIYLQNLS